MLTTDTLQVARGFIETADLTGLLERHREALDRLLNARRQLTEARRLHKDALANQDMVALDAILELEHNPDVKRASNKEGRERQDQAYLNHHGPWKIAQDEVRVALRQVEKFQDEERRAEAAVDQLGLMIAARRSELDLLASFARGAT